MSKSKLAGIIAACAITIIVVILLIIFHPWRPSVIPPPLTYSLSVNVSPSGAGSVSHWDGEYEPGAQVTLTASPASGYAFDNWSGGASGTEPTITVTMDSDKNIVANFVSNVSNSPIEVALDYFGVKDTHQPSGSFAPNTIQLYVVVDDGKTAWNYTYPFNGEGIPLSYFQLEDLSQQTIFNARSVGDHLTISALAYSCADKETTLTVGRALQGFEPSLGPLLDFYENLPQSKELIGWYEHTWYAVDEWGTKQVEYEAEGSGDLRLWFRIWSNIEPAPISKPLFVPDVTIENVELPTDARSEYPCFIPTKYPITLSLVNNEDFDVPIKWEAESSMTGEFDHGEATVPKNGNLDISKPYCWEAGERTITYTIYYYWTNAKLDTWSGSLNVTP